MPEKPTAVAILDAARGAHATSKEILELMQEPGDDPIQVIIAALQKIQDTQQALLTRLDIIERRLASPGWSRPPVSVRDCAGLLRRHRQRPGSGWALETARRRMRAPAGALTQDGPRGMLTWPGAGKWRLACPG